MEQSCSLQLLFHLHSHHCFHCFHFSTVGDLTGQAGRSDQTGRSDQVGLGVQAGQIDQADRQADQAGLIVQTKLALTAIPAMLTPSKPLMMMVSMATRLMVAMKVAVTPCSTYECIWVTAIRVTAIRVTAIRVAAIWVTAIRVRAILWQKGPQS